MRPSCHVSQQKGTFRDGSPDELEAFARTLHGLAGLSVSTRRKISFVMPTSPWLLLYYRYYLWYCANIQENTNGRSVSRWHSGLTDQELSHHSLDCTEYRARTGTLESAGSPCRTKLDLVRQSQHRFCMWPPVARRWWSSSQPARHPTGKQLSFICKWDSLFPFPRTSRLHAILLGVERHKHYLFSWGPSAGSRAPSRPAFPIHPSISS